MGQVVVALDSFKGSISAADASAAVAQGIRAARPDVPVRCCPIADGGEGTLAALRSAGFTHVPVRATGPLGERVRSGYAYRRSVAVVELADTSGLHRLPAGRADQRTAARASSLGAGQVLAAAVTDGHPTVVLALGGSACTDGGAGLRHRVGRPAPGRRGGGTAPGRHGAQPVAPRGPERSCTRGWRCPAAAASTPSSWCWHATWTTPCSALWALPPSTDPRRAPPPSRSCSSTPDSPGGRRS